MRPASTGYLAGTLGSRPKARRGPCNLPPGATSVGSTMFREIPGEDGEGLRRADEVVRKPCALGGFCEILFFVITLVGNEEVRS